MIKFINEHRKVFGVEPICKVLPIAPSTYYLHAARQTDPSKRPERAKLDGDMMIKIQRVFDENHQVYGVRKIWAQLKREGIVVARCTVARLMKFMGLKGAVRGKSIKTTVSNKNAPCPLDKVNRNFKANRPNQLWVAKTKFGAANLLTWPPGQALSMSLL
jgi:hypothetical protein